jgi:hypothetical protein
VTSGKVRAATLLTLVLAYCGGAAAQGLNQGSSEAIGYVGFNSASGSGVDVGGGYAYALRPNLLAVGEIGYLGGGGGFGFDGAGFSSHGIEFNANVHYLFILKNLPKFTPYALGGFGLDHYSFSFHDSGLGYSSGLTIAGVNIGAGARWQLGDKWGIRPEWKMLIGNHFAESFTAGVYYDFGK